MERIQPERRPGADGPDPPGIDVEALTAWFTNHVPDVSPPLRFTLIAGGRSNLTFEVSDAAGRRWALRRPPLGSTLESAHDMGRERRIISALEPTAVPVPHVAGYSDDPAVTGAQFYVMDFVDGVVLRGADVAEQALDEAGRRRAGERLVDVLVDLHEVDPDEVGLGDLARKEGYIERQLRRWHRQLEQQRTRDLPLMDELHADLSSRIPPQSRVAIVHGDYRLDNAIVGPDGDIRAVLDWELCTLGDPLADLGLLLVYWTEPGDPVQALPSAPTLAPGFPGRDELPERYARRSGRDIRDLDFYVAFGFWKLAAIVEGVYARYASGAYGRGDATFEKFAGMSEQLAEAAAQRLHGQR